MSRDINKEIEKEMYKILEELADLYIEYGQDEESAETANRIVGVTAGLLENIELQKQEERKRTLEEVKEVVDRTEKYFEVLTNEDWQYFGSVQNKVNKELKLLKV